jgi:hypothetical protein
MHSYSSAAQVLLIVCFGVRSTLTCDHAKGSVLATGEIAVYRVY